ncbi:MAG: DUF1987 domain-containing protein [Bacteroidales bacterium]|nr:DUF1987 domain-containing protein [Bacteroidales bacterium]
MDKLYYQETENSPMILFDKDANVFNVNGVSVMEDSRVFYQPVFQWIEEYIEQPNPETVINFKIEYCNTSSSKQLYELLMKFKRLLDRNHKLVVNWHYEVTDDDLRDLGRFLTNLTGINLQLITN